LIEIKNRKTIHADSKNIYSEKFGKSFKASIFPMIKIAKE